jgi:hypothetical protein
MTNTIHYDEKMNMSWKIECYHDESFAEYYDVTDGNRLFICNKNIDAIWLRKILESKQDELIETNYLLLNKLFVYERRIEELETMLSQITKDN